MLAMIRTAPSQAWQVSILIRYTRLTRWQAIHTGLPSRNLLSYVIMIRRVLLPTENTNAHRPTENLSDHANRRAAFRTEVFARSRSLPHGLVRRANIILLAEQGLSDTAIAAQVGVSNPMVAHWCKLYIADGIDGLYDLPSGGRPRTYSDDEVRT